MKPLLHIEKCKRCGRKLKDTNSINRGYGTVCWKKVNMHLPHKKLFEVKENITDAKK